MNTLADQRRVGPRPFSPLAWWVGYFFLAVWAQEFAGGKDFVTPAVLICLQMRHWWTAIWLTVLCILVHEGGGNLAFGTSLLFYTGAFVLYFASHWLLEPENPVFILVYSLALSAWLYLVLAGGMAFQEIPSPAASPWTWIGVQWACYLVWWSVVLRAFHVWVRHGRS